MRSSLKSDIDVKERTFESSILYHDRYFIRINLRCFTISEMPNLTIMTVHSLLVLIENRFHQLYQNLRGCHNLFRKNEAYMTLVKRLCRTLTFCRTEIVPFLLKGF